MNKFDKIAERLGWERLYNTGVFISKKEDKNGYLTIAFPTATGYNNFDLNDEKISEGFVRHYIYSISCSNKFKPENKSWAIPLMIADYFAHKVDFDNEIIWAKKAMERNKNLTPEHFSLNIREQL